MILQKVIVNNFKSFKKAKVILHNVNILIGKNNPGKSNFIQALDLFFNFRKKFHNENLDQFLFKSTSGRSTKLKFMIECSFKMGEEEKIEIRQIKKKRNIRIKSSNKEVETYTNFLPLLNQITTAREKLFMYGKDRLNKMEWMVLLFLTAILIFSLFIIRAPGFSSLFLSGTLVSTLIILMLILRDLNNLSFGEEMVSFEPYETIFDVIGKPRFYLKRDIEMGRVTLPKGVKYRIGD